MSCLMWDLRHKYVLVNILCSILFIQKCWVWISKMLIPLRIFLIRIYNIIKHKEIQWFLNLKTKTKQNIFLKFKGKALSFTFICKCQWCPHFIMIRTVNMISTFVTKSYVYDAALLATSTMLYSRSPEHILHNWKLLPFVQHLSISISSDPWQPSFYSLLLCIWLLLDSTCKWYYVLFFFLCLAFSPNVLQFHPFCCKLEAWCKASLWH